ncbi:MAG: phosphoribosylglycinamide formyltransferase [endosymbiont of Galathealinum brachiosum]|uniref:Phosphoribosylglycinamide formyltransferase n=1 Tax=endosymbiont of Galathealinum brachiosum TaxID=2200906 RepID=A0A370D9V8_9GAMM|nr:MAG: phosphoribosylglycinamide formyltransferase [endosymbiont of Galathealinum brachiosum]
MSTPSLNIVVLISGSGSNLQAIIDAVTAGQLHANIKAVISNRPDVKGLERALSANIPALTLDHKQFDSREAFDQQLIQEIDQHQPDLIILAGFMRILTDDFVKHYNGKMLNIHPSLLPEFTGLNTHQRALDAGVKQHGVTVHYVSNELDGGPLVLQAVIDVNENDTVESLQQRIHQQEHIIYPMVIEWAAQQRLEVIDQQVYLDKQPLENPAKWINNQLIN